MNKKPITDEYYPQIEKIDTNPKVPRFNVNDRVRTTKYKNIFFKGYAENWPREIFFY